MDSLEKYDTENCTQHLKNKKNLSAIRDNDPIPQEKIGNCLRQVYKEQFVKKLILPGKLISGEVLTRSAEESFEQALFLFFEDIRMKKFKPVKNNCEDYLFLLFKAVYLEYLTHKLRQARQQRSNTAGIENAASDQIPSMVRRYDITSITVTVLQQLSQCSRDYFIWYYVDKFNLTQIRIIAGLTADTVKENLWISREKVSRTWKQLFKFPTGDIISRQQYFMFSDYFENSLSGENEKLFRQLLNENAALQENFEHELYLRYGIDKVTLLAQTSQRSKEPFETTEEFIARVKQIAESSSPKKKA